MEVALEALIDRVGSSKMVLDILVSKLPYCSSSQAQLVARHIAAAMASAAV